MMSYDGAPMGDKEQLAVYLATCRYDWQTGARVRCVCRNDLWTLQQYALLKYQ